MLLVLSNDLLTLIVKQQPEAWGNMASVYIKLKKKYFFLELISFCRCSLVLDRPEAFRCLTEGLKHSHDNWKLWQNYLYVAVVRAVKNFMRTKKLSALMETALS